VKFVAVLPLQQADAKKHCGTYFTRYRTSLSQAKCQRAAVPIEAVLLDLNYSGAGSSSRQVHYRCRTVPVGFVSDVRHWRTPATGTVEWKAVQLISRVLLARWRTSGIARVHSQRRDDLAGTLVGKRCL